MLSSLFEQYILLAGYKCRRSLVLTSYSKVGQVAVERPAVVGWVTRGSFECKFVVIALGRRAWMAGCLPWQTGRFGYNVAYYFSPVPPSLLCTSVPPVFTHIPGCRELVARFGAAGPTLAATLSVIARARLCAWVVAIVCRTLSCYRRELNTASNSRPKLMVF